VLIPVNQELTALCSPAFQSWQIENQDRILGTKTISTSRYNQFFERKYQMKKIIMLFCFLMIMSFAMSVQSKTIPKSDDRRNQIAIGYSFEEERRYGWCFVILRQGVGLYVDSHTNAKGHSIDDNDYYASLSLETSRKVNQFIKMETHKLRYSVGITYPIISWLYGYSAIGRSLEQDYYNFFDSRFRLVDRDGYWVSDRSHEKTIGELGLIFYMNPFFIKAGMTFKPIEYQIGGGVRIY